MSELLLTPFDYAPVLDLASKSGKLFRKQILPITTINYNGKKIEFTADYLRGLVRAFHDKAYDQVPFLFADGENRHTMDPDKWRGQLANVELTDDGLYGTFELTDDAADLVRKNPNLGVSARIVMEHERADGKKWPRALQHVLGTLDPRVTGMRPWEAVSLSNDVKDLPTTDLSASTYQGDTPMGATKEKEELSAEDLQKILDDLTADADDDDELLDELDDADEDDEDEDEDDEEDDSDEDGDTEGDARLSNIEGGVVDLAAQNNALQEQVAVMQNKLAETEWQARRDEFARDGVPPAMLDLAEPVLSRPQTEVIELSNGKKTDTVKVIEALLDAARGTVDLSSALGSSVADESDKDEVLEAWESKFEL